MDNQVVGWLGVVIQLAGYMAGWKYDCFITMLNGYCGWVVFLLVSFFINWVILRLIGYYINW